MNFLIFAHARSGSTSLARLINTSPDVDLVMEPFHKDYSKWNPDRRDYSKFVVDNKTMDIAIYELSKNFNSMKILSYQFERPIYQHLLSRPNLKVIFLRRKNLAAAAISTMVAEQTSIW